MDGPPVPPPPPPVGPLLDGGATPRQAAALLRNRSSACASVHDSPLLYCLVKYCPNCRDSAVGAVLLPALFGVRVLLAALLASFSARANECLMSGTVTQQADNRRRLVRKNIDMFP